MPWCWQSVNLDSIPMQATSSRKMGWMPCPNVAKVRAIAPENKQNLIVLSLHLITLQLKTSVKLTQGMRLGISAFTITSSLPSLHTFWHAIPTSLCFLWSLYESCWSQRHSKRKPGCLNKLLAYLWWRYAVFAYVLHILRIGAIPT